MMNTGSQAVRPAPASVRGHLRPGQRIRRPPPSSSSSTGSKGTTAALSQLGSGFLPLHTGRHVPHTGDPVMYLSKPPKASTTSSSAIRSIHPPPSMSFKIGRNGRSEIPTRHQSFEMAYRMAGQRPDLTTSQRIEGNPRDVRRRTRQALLRQQLPSRPPDGRARRPLSSRSSTSMGSWRPGMA